MRKFTLFLAMMVAMVTTSMAQVTSLADFKSDKCYTVTTEKRGGWAVDAAGTIFSSTSDQKLQAATDDPNQQFAVLTLNGEDYFLYSVGAKKFVKADKSLNATSGDAIEFADASAKGEGRVRVNFKGIANAYINLGGSHQMSVDGWSTIDDGNAVMFVEAADFDATEALAALSSTVEVVYIYMYNDIELGRETIKEEIGKAYPALTKIPFGFTANTPEGVIEAAGEVVIECSFVENYPIKYAATVEEIDTWYYMQMHSNNKKYIQYLADQTYLEWADAEVAEGEEDSYTWAFVGNPATGFKLVNRAAGIEKAVCSDGNTAPALGAFADAVVWKPAYSKEAGNDAYFCLQFPGGNYMNAQSGKVAYWYDNDAGSTFLLTEREITVVEPEPVALAVVSQTPAADEVVESFNSITIEFNKAIEFIQAAGGTGGTDGTGGTGGTDGTGGTGGTGGTDGTGGTGGTGGTTGGTGTSGPVQFIKLKDANGGVAATAWVSAATIDGNKVTFTFEMNAAVTKTGTYTFEIPAGLIKATDGEEFAGQTFTFQVEEPAPALAVVSQTPAADEAVESFNSITIEFNKAIEFIQAAGGTGGTDGTGGTGGTDGTGGTGGTGGTDGTTGGTGTSGPAQFIKLKDANGGVAATAWVSAATIDGNKVTFTFEMNAAVTKTGTYTFEIPAGLIKATDGEEFAGQTFTFQVEEPVVEPEEPTTPALNETAVFDFANNVWGIPGYDMVNFRGTKTVETYTDGTKDVTIDPTKNKGEFYYENGYLRIAKPGSKIVLPAFDFAVEKIEVVGHASATSYPNVDMNVYVGNTAVSTACIGSTETYTYEIAADNQAAGNVYELVIGSNGGNYSSVMYITYVKVYPAENKLEAPKFNLESGVYVGEQTVNVHSATTELEGVTDVTYYYTTDGNEPTVEDEETDGAITITESCTLKVIVELTYGDKVYVSASSSAEYIITEEVTYHRATSVESGSYFIVADGNVAAPIEGTSLPTVEVAVEGNDVTAPAYYAITLEEAAGGYYIKDVNGKYIYNTMMNPNKLYSNTAAPMDAWTITIADDENSSAMIVCNDYVLALQNGAFCTVHIDEVADAVLPTLYGTHATGINEAVVNGEAIESIYDLQGRKIEKVTNGGIYIINGKKVLVK